MTLHSHKIDDSTLVSDGNKPSQVPAGWQIANGNADDIRVCGTHPWQSYWLVFADGGAYATAMCNSPSYIGIHSLLKHRKKNNFFLMPENRKMPQPRLPYTDCARGEINGR
jgi:hypothetical protein